jgi:putative two-component system response regulator
MEKTIQLSNAVLGLIDVRSGAVESGLSAVERALTLGRRTARTQLPEFLDICIDAYEAAGHSDKALEYLQELVEMKKKAIDSEIVPLQYDSIADPIVFQPGFSFFDERLLAKAHSLRTAVQDRIQWVIETAINAEMASGHDLYRTFRVATLSRDLAAAIGWSDERIAQLKLGARLCNIGMMAIPPRILLKATKPSNGERRLLRDHTIYGAQLLRKSKLRTFDVASAIAEQHHERYDGSGYPHGLSGESIAEEARLVAVCDAFDAMTHARPWRTTPLSNQAALNELRQEAASQFDPRFVDAFIDVFRRQFAGCDDLDAYLADGADDFEYVRARARMEGLISEEA